MALVLNNRVRETTATTGTGAQTLAGAVDGFQTFAAGIGNDNTTYYAISLNTANEWEVGLGTLNSDSSTLTRTTVLESSNSDSAVDFAAGTKEIFCTLPSEKAVYLDASGDQVGGFASLVADTTPQLGGDLDVNGNAIVSASDGDIAINANGTGVVTMTANSVTGDVIPGKVEGTNFTDSLIVGHSTTGTLSSALRNTIVGIDAGNAITSANDNVIMGFNAGGATTTSYDNVLIGRDAGATTTTAMISCVGIGKNALYTNNYTNNVAIGRDASYYTTGRYNTVVGTSAGTGTTSAASHGNSFFGRQAGTAVTSGSYNVAVGYTSGNNITTGSGNVVIGNADVSSATGDDQLSISDGEDGSVVWITGESTGNTEVAVNWNPSLSTTGKALVMGF